MKCETCEGKGFIEYEHGLIMVGCQECGGTGEVEEVLSALDPSSITTKEEADKRASEMMNQICPPEVPDDSISRDKRDNQPTGSKDTGKHKQPRKPKARKKVAKRPS